MKFVFPDFTLGLNLFFLFFYSPFSLNFFKIEYIMKILIYYVIIKLQTTHYKILNNKDGDLCEKNIDVFYSYNFNSIIINNNYILW
jgi:hypothetical protein